MEQLRIRAKKAIKFTIEECTKLTQEQHNKLSKRNNHGIKIISSCIPEKRDGINEWFKRFTI